MVFNIEDVLIGTPPSSGGGGAVSDLNQTWDMTRPTSDPTLDGTNSFDATYDDSVNEGTYTIPGQAGLTSAGLVFQEGFNIPENKYQFQFTIQDTPAPSGSGQAWIVGFTSDRTTLESDIADSFTGDPINASTFFAGAITKGNFGHGDNSGTFSLVSGQINGSSMGQDAGVYSTEITDGENFDILFNSSAIEAVRVSTDETVSLAADLSSNTHDLYFFVLVVDFGSSGFTKVVPLNFFAPDYSGYTSLGSTGDASIPQDAEDGSRYIADPGAVWKTYDVQTGDVVEFYNSTQDIFIYRDFNPAIEIPSITEPTQLFLFPGESKDEDRGVYANWTDVYNASQNISGPIQIVVDYNTQDIEIPSGTYDFSNITFKSFYPNQANYKFVLETDWTGNITLPTNPTNAGVSIADFTDFRIDNSNIDSSESGLIDGDDQQDYVVYTNSLTVLDGTSTSQPIIGFDSDQPGFFTVNYRGSSSLKNLFYLHSPTLTCNLTVNYLKDGSWTKSGGIVDTLEEVKQSYVSTTVNDYTGSSEIKTLFENDAVSLGTTFNYNVQSSQIGNESSVDGDTVTDALEAVKTPPLTFGFPRQLGNQNSTIVQSALYETFAMIDSNHFVHAHGTNDSFDIWQFDGTDFSILFSEPMSTYMDDPTLGTTGRAHMCQLGGGDVGLTYGKDNGDSTYTFTFINFTFDVVAQTITSNTFTEYEADVSASTLEDIESIICTRYDASTGNGEVVVVGEDSGPTPTIYVLDASNGTEIDSDTGFSYIRNNRVFLAGENQFFMSDINDIILQEVDPETGAISEVDRIQNMIVRYSYPITQNQYLMILEEDGGSTEYFGIVDFDLNTYSVNYDQTNPRITPEYNGTHMYRIWVGVSDGGYIFHYNGETSGDGVLTAYELPSKEISASYKSRLKKFTDRI